MIYKVLPCLQQKQPISWNWSSYEKRGAAEMRNWVEVGLCLCAVYFCFDVVCLNLNAIMLGIRRSFVAVSPLKPCVFFATKTRPSKSAARGRGLRRDSRLDNLRFGANPGIQSQVSLLGLTKQDLKDPEIMEDMEKQFWDADKVGDDIDRAEHINKELLQIYQIQRKQLKEEKLPNMLFWDEKQEIKTLHANDPEKWTIMRLAFSYPASPSVIKKVLKSQMKLRSQEEIERHDRRVQRNWEEYSEGKLRIQNKVLEKHLMAFTKRNEIRPTTCKDISSVPAKDFNPLSNILKDGGVFASIYQSYQKATENSNSKEVSDEEVCNKKYEDSTEMDMRNHQRGEDSFMVPLSVQNVRLRTNEPHTLESMRAKVLHDAVRGKELGESEKSFVQDALHKEIESNHYKQIKDPIGATLKEKFTDRDTHLSHKRDHSARRESGEEIVPSAHSGNNTQDFQDSEATHVDNASKYVDLSKLPDHQIRENEELLACLKTAKIERSSKYNVEINKVVKDYVMNSSGGYPMQIAIPKDLWQKNKLYRVKDRFYTDDGEFLYRVPGLCKE
ncbi:hypothetical protein ONE63_002532 [Megalurothrips usitatus]|uniref:Neurite outgrowth-associated protein n=1 Tax=Megalurothrips usitatus TaxID=439358 RepID=A0AAV7XEK3_9NEOP|nr:hypothetical protein ONE63_002532 [Megalurothrips usitatus]